jgi:hypothetical protein
MASPAPQGLAPPRSGGGTSSFSIIREVQRATPAQRRSLTPPWRSTRTHEHVQLPRLCGTRPGFAGVGGGGTSILLGRPSRLPRRWPLVTAGPWTPGTRALGRQSVLGFGRDGRRSASSPMAQMRPAALPRSRTRRWTRTPPLPPDHLIGGKSGQEVPWTPPARGHLTTSPRRSPKAGERE